MRFTKYLFLALMLGLLSPESKAMHEYQDEKCDTSEYRDYMRSTKEGEGTIMHRIIRKVLRGPDLQGCDFSGRLFIDHDFGRSDVRGVDFSGANFMRVNIRDIIHNEATIFTNARYDVETIFPKGFDPKSKGMVFVGCNKDNYGWHAKDKGRKLKKLIEVTGKGCDLSGYKVNVTDIHDEYLEILLNDPFTQFAGITYDVDAVFPEGFDPKSKGMVFVGCNKDNYKEYVRDGGRKLKKLIEVTGKDCDLQGDNFSRDSFRGDYFGPSDVRGAKLNSSDFRGADVRDIIYDEDTDFEGSFYDGDTIFPKGFDPESKGMMEICDTSSYKNYIRNPYKMEDYMHKVGKDWKGWNIAEGCNFAGDEFVDTDFSGGFLYKADFQDTQSKGADFSCSQLPGAKFSGAIVFVADFRGTNLEGMTHNAYTRFINVIYDDNTKFPKGFRPEEHNMRRAETTKSCTSEDKALASYQSQVAYPVCEGVASEPTSKASCENIRPGLSEIETLTSLAKLTEAASGIRCHLQPTGSKAFRYNVPTSNLSMDLQGGSYPKGDFRRIIFDGTKAEGTDFSGANFRGADMEGMKHNSETQFTGAKYDVITKLPKGLDPGAANMIFISTRYCYTCSAQAAKKPKADKCLSP